MDLLSSQHLDTIPGHPSVHAAKESLSELDEFLQSSESLEITEQTQEVFSVVITTQIQVQ